MDDHTLAPADSASLEERLARLEQQAERIEEKAARLERMLADDLEDER